MSLSSLGGSWGIMGERWLGGEEYRGGSACLLEKVLFDRLHFLTQNTVSGLETEISISASQVENLS